MFAKGEVVRIAAGPEGILLDYREKLPGRAAYVCPTDECIGKAFTRDHLAKALKARVAPPSPAAFQDLLRAAIRDRMASLVTMAAKAGKVAAGTSAVDDQVRKGRALLVLFTVDLAEGTKEKLLAGQRDAPVRQIVCFTTSELGGMLGRELVGSLAISDQGFAEALWNEAKRLKRLDK